MLRTALLSAVAALGIAGAASAQVYYPQVTVRTPVVIASHRHAYEVEFRRRSCDPWIVYTRTWNHDRAHDMARSLWHHGYQTRVDHH